jgi:hypothetical protein
MAWEFSLGVAHTGSQSVSEALLTESREWIDFLVIPSSVWGFMERQFTAQLPEERHLMLDPPGRGISCSTHRGEAVHCSTFRERQRSARLCEERLFTARPPGERLFTARPPGERLFTARPSGRGWDNALEEGQ